MIALKCFVVILIVKVVFHYLWTVVGLSPLRTRLNLRHMLSCVLAVEFVKGEVIHVVLL